MTSAPAEKDQRPWDARLLERMSRGAGTAGGDESSPLYVGLSHGLIGAIVAGLSGHVYLIGFALLYSPILVWRYLWPRYRHGREKRSARATRNPFGQ